MKKALILATVLSGVSFLAVSTAHAGFSMKDLAGNMSIAQPAAPAPVQAAPASAPITVTKIARKNSKPSLEIINDRYVPDDIKKKYNMGDDYFEMNKAATTAPTPIVVEAQPLESLPVPQQQPVSQVHTMTVTPVPVAVTSVEKTTPKALIVEDSVKKPIVPLPAERFETWRARKGELLKDVLARWAERSGTDFVWSAAESPKVSSDFSFIGKFEDATSKLMAQDSGQLKMKFADGAAEQPVDLQTSSLQTTMNSEMDTMSQPAIILDLPKDDMQATEVPAATEGKTWYAASGTSLKTALEAWSEKEGASLVWQTEDNFTVRKSMNDKEGYEDAVAKVLTQFDGQKTRPVGQLHKNPVTGEKVLVIRTDTAG